LFWFQASSVEHALDRHAHVTSQRDGEYGAFICSRGSMLWFLYYTLAGFDLTTHSYNLQGGRRRCRGGSGLSLSPKVGLRLLLPT
jgi:hypothetical protein